MVKGDAPRANRRFVACGLTRRFDDLPAVYNASLSVLPDEIFGLIGSNGAGKSRLIKMLTTLLPPSSGTALVAGFDIKSPAAKVRRCLGYVPQLLSADGTLTGYEKLLLSVFDSHRGRTERINEALKMMNLMDEADRLVQHYSGWMIRRLEQVQPQPASALA